MIENSHGIILQRRNTLSGDLFVHLFSHKGESIPCYAKGAGQSHSRRRKFLEPFHAIAWTIRKSKHSFYLGECQSLQSFHHIQSDMWTLQSLLCYGEFLQMAILENDPHPEIYELLRESLEALHQNIHPSFILRLWRQSLQELGYIDPEQKAFHHLEARYQKGLLFLQGASLEEASKLKLQPHESDILHEVLLNEAEKHLDKKLRHRDFFNPATPLE